ncbi:hypothetical protein Tco_0270239 [Tanacetum coccineum]
MYHQKNVDYVELLSEDFTYHIDNKVYKKQEKMYYPRFTKAITHHFLIQEKSLSWRNRIGMHTSKDDYLINTLRFISRKASQKYGVVLPECLTSPEMKESKTYKIYLSYATGEVPPKVARKFKKASQSNKESELVPGDEEHVKKGKRLKTPAKKSASKPATGIIIKEPPVETNSNEGSKNESLRDFHKNHSSGSGTVLEKPPSVEKIRPTVISEGTGDKPGVPDVTNDDSFESKSESWGNDEDDSNNEQESSDEINKQENESEEQELDSEQDKESDDDDQEQEEFDQENEFEDDEMKNARLEEPIETATGIVQGEGNDTEMTEAQQGNENLETTQEQVVKDAHVIISTVPKKTEEVSNFAPPMIEKLIKESHDEVTLAKVSSQPQSTYEATSTLTEFELKKILLDKMEKSESYLTAPEHQDCYDDKDKDEDPSAGSDRGLKERKTSKDVEPTTGPKKKDSTSGSSKGTKSQPKSTGKYVQSEEPVFEVADSDMPQDREGNLGDNEDEPRDETASRCEWFKKPTPPQEPTNPD